MSSSPDIPAAAARMRSLPVGPPEVLLVLGSGLGHLVDAVEDGAAVPFTDLPGFPAAGVAGHAGRFVAGRFAGRNVLLQAGRYHVYEGHPLEVVAAPVRLAAELGIGIVVLTNAAGGVDPALEPGEIVLIEDHLNLMLRSPLTGSVLPGEDRFPDMSAPYDPELRAVAMGAAGQVGVRLRGGIYAAVPGPSFETAAEVRMIRGLGADVVGMSTVPEVIVARARGLRCLAFSVVTNKGTGLSDVPQSHADVMEVGRRAGHDLGRVLEATVRALPQSTEAK